MAVLNEWYLCPISEVMADAVTLHSCDQYSGAWQPFWIYDHRCISIPPMLSPSSAASCPVLQPVTTMQLSSCLHCPTVFRLYAPTGRLQSSSYNPAWPMGGSCWPHQAFFPWLLASFSQGVCSVQRRKPSEVCWNLERKPCLPFCRLCTAFLWCFRSLWRLSEASQE